MQQSVIHSISACLDWLWPRTCILCGRVCRLHNEHFSCRRCRSRYQFMPARLNGHSWEQAKDGLRTASLLRYAATGARLVQVLKYEGGSFLGREIRSLLPLDRQWLQRIAGAALVPVPLHPCKLRKRGYNQAHIIAEAICASYPDVVLHPCLQRIRATPSQTRLSRHARCANVDHAFRRNCPPLPGRQHLLIDDVLTSGATLRACARALQLPCDQIAAFTLAHG